MAGDKAAAGRLRISFAYIDQSTVVDGIEMGLHGVADAPLGIGCVRAFAQNLPSLAGRVEMRNHLFPTGGAEDAMVDELLRARPDMLAFSVMGSCDQAMRVCAKVKARDASIRVVVGGPGVPRAPDKLARFLALRPFVDVGVFGEGEETFAAVLEARLAGRGFEGILGLGFRRGEEIVVELPREPLADLSRAPSPLLTGSIAVAAGSRGFLLVETSRGCPFVCSYCDVHLGAHSVRRFPPARLRAELDFLRSRRFEGTLCITDPLLNLRKDHFVEVMGILKEWPSRVIMNLLPEMFDEESIRAIAGVPRGKIYLGIQSTNPETVRNLKRPRNMARCTENVQRLVEVPNLQIVLELILGLPGDTYESFKLTMDWALSFRPRPRIIVYDLVLLPEAPLFPDLAAFGYQTDESGEVTATASSPERDLLRSAWLVTAYRHMVSRPETQKTLERVLDQPGVRPSEALERLAVRLAKSGQLPQKKFKVPTR